MGLEVLYCIYHFQPLLLTTKVSTKGCFLAYIPTLPHWLGDLSRITPITIGCLIKFCCIYDNSSALQLFNIIMSLFLHLVSLLSFQEIRLIKIYSKSSFFGKSLYSQCRDSYN